MKISEELILRHRNSLRNDIVRFPEEIFVKKNRSGLSNGFLRLDWLSYIQRYFCNDYRRVSFEIHRQLENKCEVLTGVFLMNYTVISNDILRGFQIPL